MSQTTYNLVPPVAVEGMIADNREACVIVARLAQGLCPVGKLVVPGTDSMIGPPLTSVTQASTNPGQVAPMGAGLVTDPMIDSVWTGIPIYDATRAPYDSSLGFSCYADKDTVPVLLKGAIYVSPEAGAIVSQQDVWVRTAANGGLTTLGKFAPAAGTGLVKFTRGRWLSGLMQSNIAVLLIW